MSVDAEMAEETLNEVERKRFELVTKSPTEEILTRPRLIEAIVSGQTLRHYIGFEISGFVHLGTGLLSMAKVADLQAAGVETSLFLADYHSWINKKLGGDLETIQKIAGNYFREALQISLRCMGGNPEKAKVVLGSDLYEKLGRDYFENVLKVASMMSLSRARRSITVLGRKEGDTLSLSQLIYVPMQVADIYSMDINLAHAGMDQRKAHVVALDSSGAFEYKPMALHHHLLMGLQLTAAQRSAILQAKGTGDREQLENQLIDVKMSKSKPQSAIFIHDTEEEIKRKVMQTYCPTNETEINPLVDMMRYIIWPYLATNSRAIEITNAKTKQTVPYQDIKSFEDAIRSNGVHPADLKAAIADYLIEILQPARKHFLDGSGRRSLEELRSIEITR